MSKEQFVVAFDKVESILKHFLNIGHIDQNTYDGMLSHFISYKNIGIV